MARLLSDEDFLFLQAQPGFKPEIGRKFVQERRRVFRMYLRELANDFHDLHEHARAIAAGLSEENSPLIGMLIRSKFRFWYELMAIETRLSLSHPAFSFLGGVSLDARGLVEAVGSMHMEISRLAAPSAA
jgi:hypothetical protein